MTFEQQLAVEKQFHGRLIAMGIDGYDRKQGQSAKVLKLQAEFFCGAMAAAVAFEGEKVHLPPSWVIWIGSGRSILRERAASNGPNLVTPAA